jgi:DNA polymerase V
VLLSPLILNRLALHLPSNLPARQGVLARPGKREKMTTMENVILELSLPAGKISSGKPTAAMHSKTEHIDLNELIPHPAATILVQHSGLSMINAFIPPEAVLVVDKSIMPENGSIVLARLNGVLMVRYLKKNDYKRKLIPANPKYAETEVLAGMDFVILGVVTQVISDPGKLRNIW